MTKFWEKATAVATLLLLGIAFYVYPANDSASMAGWVQAIGTLAALALAIALQYEASHAGRNQADIFANAFCGQLLVTLGGLKQTCMGKDAHS